MVQQGIKDVLMNAELVEKTIETAPTVNKQSDVQYTPGACSTIWATLNHFPQQNTFLLHLSILHIQ